LDYISAAISDTGSRTGTNQDAILVKSRMTCIGNVCIGVICDGMGGLAYGEVASAHVVRSLSECFMFKAGEIKRFDKLVYYLEKELNQCSRQIYEYSQKQGVMIGTTATVLITSGGQYAVIHVGDTRAYRLTGGIAGHIKQLTADQSINDYMLTQSIGTGENLHPDIVRGRTKKGDVFLLCTDGFRHKNDNYSLKRGFIPQAIKGRTEMEKNLKIYAQRARELGETDDISAFVLKIL
jgi:serine/threonine protein phosphatase PrpC